METIYKAFDGTEFATEDACLVHEQRLRNPMAYLACTNPKMITHHDVGVPRIVDGLFTLRFADGSIIEITHNEVKVFDQSATRCFHGYTYNRNLEN